MKRFNYTYLTLMHLLAFAVSFFSFFTIFRFHFDILGYAGSPLAISAIAFCVIYLLMCKVYGGMDIAKKKSKPIIYSYIINLLVTDFFTHLFLCILASSFSNSGKFYYEAPLLLLVVYLVQMLLICALTYMGNGMFFCFNKPAKCLIIKRPQDNADVLIKKIGKLKRQYSIEKVCDHTDPHILDAIDASDVVFIYNLAVSERTVLVEYCYSKPKEVFYSVEITDILATGSARTLFDDTSMIHYSLKTQSLEQKFLKRTMDLVISLIGLVIASPFMLVTAIAIKAEDGGPVFYRQPRVTYNGKIFNVLKFRSMRVADGSIHRSATKNDDRITRVGRVIRKFRIDELPQLINILKGDMSLVGPRPEMVENVEKYTQQLPEFSYRLRAKAGLTGMAQLYGKYNTSAADKLALDLFYIESNSIFLDIKLILRTVLVFLTPDESTEEFDSSEQSDQSSGNEVQKV